MGNGQIKNIYKRKDSIGFTDINTFIEKKTKFNSLHEACLTGDRKIVHQMIKKGYDIQERDNEHRTPLHVASKNGSVELVGYLLNNGADPNSSDKAGWRPLHYAASYGHHEIVDEILKWSNHLEPVTTIEGYTPLHLAIFNRHISIIQLLLYHGADINRKDRSGSSPLHAAALVGDLDTIEIIISNEGDITLCDYHGYTALDYASQQGHSDCIKYLITNGADVSHIDTLWKTALHKCCEFSHPQAVRTLIQCGAAIEVLDKLGQTPLLKACTNGHVEVVQALVNHKANIEACDFGGLTALHLAARNGHTKMVEFLINRGIMVNILDSNGNTPLHCACMGRYVNTAIVLLRNGARPEILNKSGLLAYYYFSASGGKKSFVNPSILMRAPNIPSDKYRNRITRILNVSMSGELHLLRQCKREIGLNLNEKDNYGESALHYTCRLGFADMMIYLLNHGANILDIDTWGFTPLHIACENNKSELIKTLIRAGTDINIQSEMGLSPLHIACYFGANDSVKKLLKYGADIHLFDDLHRQPIYLACLSNNSLLVSILLASGADSNSCDEQQNSLLHMAAYIGNPSIIQSLLTNGANIEATNSFGKTPLHIACEFNQLKSVEELINAGANPSAVTKWGLTPLHCCCVRGYTDIAIYLLQLARFYPCSDPLVFALRNPAPRKPNDRRVIDSEEVKQFKKYLQEDYNIRAVDVNGNTPLHYACFQTHKECIHALLDRGAKYNALNHNGQTPMSYIQNPQLHREFLIKGEKLYRLIRQQMRINDVLPSDGAIGDQEEQSENEKKNHLLSFFHPNYSLMGKNPKKTHSLTVREIEDKLRKLSFNFLSYKISINYIANQILSDKEKLIKNLKNENVELIKSGFESFKMYQWNESLYCYEKSYCISGIIDFIEREFIIKKKVTKVHKIDENYNKKNQIDVNQGDNNDDNDNNNYENNQNQNEKKKIQNTLNSMSNTVYYTCELIQLVKKVRVYYETDEENENEVFEEKFKNEQNKDFIFRLTKKCLEILTETQWDETQLSRQSMEERGLA